jgi:hypothetical protein
MIPARLYTDSRAGTPALENLGVSTLDIWGATASHSYDDSFSLRTPWYRYTGRPISEEDFNRQYGDSGIPYDPNMTEELADFLLEKKQQREIDEYVLSLGKGGFVEQVGQFVTGMVAANLTPINLEASFVPIGGQAKWAAMGLKYGKFNAGLAKGFVGGSAGQTILEPFTHYERKLEGRDYGLKESAENVLMSGLFGASLHGVGYGFKKLKDRYFATPETLHDVAITDNPVINKQFKELVTGLRGKTYPSGIEPVLFDVSEAQSLKNTIWQEAKEKFPEFFEQEHKTAMFEETLHQEFATGGDRAKIPQELLKQLETDQNRLEYLRKQYESNPDFVEIMRRLEDIDSGISHRLEYEQQELRAYDLDPADIHIAARQLEEGKFIDLEDPHNAGYIFEPTEDITEHKASAEMNGQLVDQLENNKEEYNKRHNNQKLLDAIAFIDRYRQSPSEGLKDYLKQVDLRQMTVAQEYTGGLLNDLMKADLLEQYRSKAFETDIARELYNTTGKNPKPTASSQAKAIAELIHKRQFEAVARANRAGANISLLPGYITRQSHNSYAMRKAGYDKWRSFILPLLDFELTDKNIDLQQVFDNLATGEHMYNMAEYLPDSKPPLSGVNIMHRFEAMRKLHFKSADAWLKYNGEYGTHPLAESIALNLGKLGKATGLLESIGSDPKEALRTLREYYSGLIKSNAALNKGNNRHELSEFAFLTKSSKPDHILDLIMGNIAPENPTIAKLNSSWNSLRIMADLGSIVLSSIPDAATFAAEQVNNGIPILTAHANILKALTHSFSSAEKKEFARLLGCATDNLLGSMHRELNAEYAVPNAINKAVNIFMRLNLMSWWDNNFKSTLGLILSHNLACQLKRPYAKAPRELRLLLERYDIGEHNWDIYRSLIKKADDGREYVLPAKQVPDDINNNLRRYLRDRVDTGSPTTHASERYLTTRGTNAGTVEGALLRMFMQYKQYPVNYIARSLKDYTVGQLPAHERTSTIGDIPRGIARSKIFPNLIITATALGYLSIAAKKIAKGEEVPDPADYKTWEYALIKGGGLGFYGEFLFSQYNRYNHTFLQELFGARTADIFVDVPAIYTDIKNGNLEQAQAATQSLVCRNLALGHSLFYLPVAANKLLDLDYKTWDCKFKQ